MQSLWSDRDFDALLTRYGAQGVSPDVVGLVYASRLVGGDRRLVLHGGGNSSVKTLMPDLLGDEVEAICVKGSGWDMGNIEPAGLPAARLAALRKSRRWDTLSDEDMVRLQRASLLDPDAPNLSVEALLHAFLPHKFILHTHSTAVLSITDQPDGAVRVTDLFGRQVGIVDYVMPGFLLAKAAAEAFERDPAVEGLVLLKHGVFSFGDTAREAYERMIALVSQAENAIARQRKPGFLKPGQLPPQVAPLAEVAPILRGACAQPDPARAGAYRRLILDFRTNDAIQKLVDGSEIERYGRAGVATPDHTIRTRNYPLLVPPPEPGRLDAFKTAVRAAVDRFVADYHDYFARQNAASKVKKRELDPMPRVILVPGLGLFGLGRTAKDAAVAADIAEIWVETVSDAEAIGRFESIPEKDLFEIEYWSLEQAKLGKSPEKPLAGQVAVVTGGAGTIGYAVARAMRDAGAEIVILDRAEAAPQETAGKLGGLGLVCDVTDAEAVAAAFDKIAERFGGVDIVVSNAGAAWQGRIGEVEDRVLRDSFELNFFAHQTVARHAVRIMLAQGAGGCLLFNASKQAVNPGADFGPYGLPKAATLFLVRQYAVDYGRDGIRANAVNADRIRGGLLTAAMIAARAKARGIDERTYMEGNLLGREVTAEDVAQAFLHHALALNTTADVTTVDGGNIAAILR